MRKFEPTDALSNLLVFTSVSLAFTPLLFGDHLFLMVSGFLNDSFVMLDQLSTYLTQLMS